jgi:hypothetical protein
MASQFPAMMELKVSDEASVAEAVFEDTTKSRSPVPETAKLTSRYWPAGVAMTLSLLLWAPRLTGPIDLRWDAGVYYVLGTSLATGHGYRILNEPGLPQALQYPPLLPAVVALYQRALGSTDPAVVGPWLRLSYATGFLIYALVVLTLARRYLRPVYAVAATALCLFHIWTIFMSDVLFAEIPFALISVVFVLVATSSGRFASSQGRVREAALFVLATAGFLLRTAGVVLFAGWVIDALMRRCWRLAVVRVVLACLPIFLWQTYIERVRHSDEYRHPVYEYQRAAYQHYNVTYFENIRLIDPFKPEQGLADGRAMASRLLRNFAMMPAYLGQAVSAPKVYWRSALQFRPISQFLLPMSLVLIPLLAFGGAVIAGFILFVRDRAWGVATIIVLSIALMCFTPWPEEFNRYLAPLAPFLTIAGVVALQRLDTIFRLWRSSRTAALGRVVIAGLVVLALAVQARAAVRLFHSSQETLAESANGIGPAGAHFFYDRNWLAWEQAVAWISSHAAHEDIVATTAPHQVYLRTGLRAVYPPFDPNPLRARHQLTGVPVKYVIIDEFEYRDFSHRYALPAVESDPAAWRLVYSIRDTRVYECITKS